MGMADVLGLRVKNQYAGTPQGYSLPTSLAGIGGRGNPSAYQAATLGSSYLDSAKQSAAQLLGHSQLMQRNLYGAGARGFSDVNNLSQLTTQGPYGSGSTGSGGGANGVATNRKQPGVISRIFDVLGRPEMAIASAIKESSLDPNRDPNTGGRLQGSTKFEPGKILQGLERGITGKDKTTFVDLYNDPASPTMPQYDANGKQISGGLPGGQIARTAAGLVQGTMTDPLTYLSLGTSKLATAPEDVAKATKGAGEIAKAERTAQAAQAANTATQVASNARTVQGGAALAQAVASQARRGASTAEDINRAGQVASRLPRDAKALQLKFAGIPIAQSQKAYTAGRIITDPLRYNGLSQTIANTFKAGHTLPEGIHNLQRIYAGVGRQNTVEKADEVLRTVKGLSKADDQVIHRAIQTGQDLATLTPEQRAAAEYYKGELGKLASATGKKVKPDDLKFTPMSAFKGGPMYDRASVNFIHQYDQVMRSRAYQDFLGEVSRRFPDDAKLAEVKDALEKSKAIFGTQGENSAKWQYYIDKAQQPWRKFVTAYRPGFQVKHMLGDLFNANLAGTDLSRFTDAAKVLGKDTHLVDDAAKTIKLGDRMVSPAEVDRLYHAQGLGSGYIQSEIMGKPQRALGHAITQFSAQRERYTRLATFMTYVDKYMKEGMTMDKAAERASADVRKFHFDYSDLTPAERSLRRFVPFYTYTKNELPLLLEHTLTNPHKITQVSRLGQLAQSIAGVPPDPNNPFPGIDQVMPSWLSSRQEISTGPNRVLTPGLPTDHLSWVDPMEAVKQAEGMVTPLIKAPIELSRGTTLEGIPIRQKGSKGTAYTPGRTPESNLHADLRYAANYLPYGSLAGGGKTSTADKLTSMLTGMAPHTVRGKPVKASKWSSP